MLRRCGGAARGARACGDRSTARGHPGADRGVGRQGHARGGRHHRRARPGDQAGDARRRPPLLSAHHRAELSRHRRAGARPQCQFRLQPAHSRQARLSLPVRRARDRRARLGRRAWDRLLLCGLHGGHGRCGCGRSARHARLGHLHRRDPALSGDDPRRAQIHVGGTVGVPRQARDRDQIGAARGLGPGGGDPYRRAGRQRCRGRCRVSPGGLGARRRSRGSVRGGGDAHLPQAHRQEHAADRDQWRGRRHSRRRRFD